MSNLVGNLVPGNITNFSCFVNGQKSSADSPASCFFHVLPYFLQNIYFGYITMAFLIAIMLISCFGNIKESYRWFIFNQAIFDLFIIYDAICDTVPGGIDSGEVGSCFYSTWRANSLMHLRLGFGTVKNIVFVAAYTPLMLLAASRFLAMYFAHFYKRISQPLFVIFGMLIFQVLFLILINAYDWTNILNGYKPNSEKRICGDLFNFNGTDIKVCLAEIQKNRPWYFFVFDNVKSVLPPIALILTDFFAIFVIAKIASQFTYQAKHNRSSFISSVKIAFFVLFQCLILTCLCFVFISVPYIHDIAKFFGFSVNSWFYFLGRQETLQWLSVLRIFIDSITVFILLTEYRKNVLLFIRFLMRKSKIAISPSSNHMFSKRDTSVIIVPPSQQQNCRRQTAH